MFEAKSKACNKHFWSISFTTMINRIKEIKPEFAVMTGRDESNNALNYFSFPHFHSSKLNMTISRLSI